MPTLEVIQEKLKKLQAQADALIAKKAQSALDQIRRLMLEHGLTTEDIEAKAKAKREANALLGSGVGVQRRTSSALGTKVAPKFQDPKSGATWTGRGSAPAWIAKAKNRTRFLIKDNASAAGATALSGMGNTNAIATKKQRGYPTGPQPAKYRDKKTGATWSGKGRAPAWLASVKDRTKFLIENEGTSKGTDVAAKASRKTTTVSKTASSSKKSPRAVTVKKAVAKKANAASKALAKASTHKPVTTSRKVAAKKSRGAARKREMAGGVAEAKGGEYSAAV